MTEALSAYEDQVRAIIRERGWVVLNVPAPDGESAWVHTAGMTEVGLAELVMVGVPAGDEFVSGALACVDFLAGLSLDEDLQPGQVYPIPTQDSVRVAEFGPDRGLPWMVHKLYGAINPRLLLITPEYEG